MAELKEPVKETLSLSSEPPTKDEIGKHNGEMKKNTSKKRKRFKKKSEEEKGEELLQFKIERYNKLVYQAKKQLLKHAKQCRTFILQKNIRKIKQKNSESSDKNKEDDDEKTKLQALKEISLDQVVEQALRQLGLLHANPDPNAEFPSVSSQNISDQVKSILTHNRFKSVLEEWHEKVTEYRRWTLKLDERQKDRPMGGGKRSKKELQKLKQQKQIQQQQQPTSLFCSLNDDSNAAGGDNEMTSPYGPGAYMDDPPPVKKNRQGQRARRAKAMAIQAKKEGKRYESLNWRQSKAGDDEEQSPHHTQQHYRDNNSRHEHRASTADHENHPSWSAAAKQKTGIVKFQGSKISFGDTADSGANKSDEAQHPSWAAKQSQKTGIVAFKGTKITF